MSGFTAEAEHELISASLEVEQLDTTLFRSKSLELPRHARGVFGGQVISQALVSATNSVDPSYAIHVSLLLYWLLRADQSTVLTRTSVPSSVKYLSERNLAVSAIFCLVPLSQSPSSTLWSEPVMAGLIPHALSRHRSRAK